MAFSIWASASADSLTPNDSIWVRTASSAAVRPTLVAMMEVPAIRPTTMTTATMPNQRGRATTSA